MYLLQPRNKRDRQNIIYYTLVWRYVYKESALIDVWIICKKIMHGNKKVIMYIVWLFEKCLILQYAIDMYSLYIVPDIQTTFTCDLLQSIYSTSCICIFNYLYDIFGVGLCCIFFHICWSRWYILNGYNSNQVTNWYFQ